jgi:tetratricopeptide (TPR) repeat protein
VTVALVLFASLVAVTVGVVIIRTGPPSFQEVCTMPQSPRRPSAVPTETPLLQALAQRDPLDFETELYAALLVKLPDQPDVLRAQAKNFTLKGLLDEGLRIDERLVRVRPKDPTAHYNLACRYALLRQSDEALRTLRRAVELGYRDFRYMRKDRDLESIRKDPRYRQLLREFGGKK